jgi:hypothetical protein
VPEPAGTTEPQAELVSEPGGTPWERRGELGFWTALLQTLQQALLEPGKLFASARLDRGRAQLGFAVLVTSVSWAVGQVVEALLLRGQREQLRDLLGNMSQNPNLPPSLRQMVEAQMEPTAPGSVIGLALFTPAFAFVLLYVNAAVTHAVAALLGQARRGFAATFAACAYACAPLVLLAVPACGSIVAVIWVIALTGIGMKVVHRASSVGAAASVLVPYLLLCCLGFLAFGTVMMTLRKATGAP